MRMDLRCAIFSLAMLFVPLPAAAQELLLAAAMESAVDVNGGLADRVMRRGAGWLDTNGAMEFFTALEAPGPTRPASLADTTAVLRAVLEPFGASQGPIRLLVAEVFCAEAEDWGPFGPQRVVPCRSDATDSALASYARARQAQIIEPADVTPLACPWNAPAGVGGMRLSVLGFTRRDDAYLVALDVACTNDDPIIGGFFNLRIFEVTEVEGVWRARQLSSLIT
jgi:hypothetical protein